MPEWLSSLLTACRRRPLWTACAVLLGLASLVMLPWDAAVQAPLRAWADLPGVQTLLDLVRPFGRGEVAVLLALTVAASGRRRLGAQLLTALIVAALLTWVFKLGVGRLRPNDGAYSFVSGDTSTVFALVPLLARSWGWSLGAVAVAVGVALSRVVLNYHWPADVLGGAAVGLLGGVVASGLWPQRPKAWLSDRRLWLGLAATAWVAAAVWASVSPKVEWLRVFLLVYGPALLAWALWPWLRRRLRAGWLPPAWAVAAGLAVLLTGLAAGHTLLDRDEPRNALAAREMLANDAWLVPTFDGEPRLHKPILPYWLMTACLRTGLPADLACRLPAVLCMALAVLLLGLTARRLVDGRAATIAMLVLAGSPLVLVSGSAATTDAVLLLGISATMWVVVRCLLDGPRGWHVPAAGVAIAWALLAKGPMALLVPLATVGVVTAWSRSAAGRGLVTWRTWVVLLAAVGLGLGLAALWFVPADRSLDGALWREMIGDHVINRMLHERESHGGKFWYYLPVLAVACLAWLPALVVALRQGAGGAGLEPRPRLLLLAWALPVLLAVSLVQTKLPHYVLPMLWPVAVLLGVAVADGHTVWWRWGRRIQAGLLLVVGIALLAAPAIAGVLQAAGVLRAPLPLAPLAAPALAVGLAFLAVLGFTGTRARFVGGAALGMAAVAVALAANAWRLEPYKPAATVAAQIRERIPPGTPISTCGFDEPSLYFYLGPERGPITTLHGAGDLRAWIKGSGAAVLVATARYYDEAGGAALPATVLLRQPGYNYSNGKALEIVVLVRADAAR